MKPLFPLTSSRSTNRAHHLYRSEGAALVIVLAFVVMLLTLLMAYFSRGTLQNQISSASSHIIREDLLAQSAIDTVISDLRQEIAAGSSSKPVGSGSTAGTLYFPITNTTMVPAISGFTTNAGLENLVKISKSGATFYPSSAPYTGTTNTPSSRAAAAPTTEKSATGRSITLARWNKPSLVSSTAANSFPAPDWILVARDGSTPTTWNANMQWSASNNTTVIGRYACAIYNEGGLLDANVAGYPAELTGSGIPSGLSPAYKGGAYFADLTQIGMTPDQIKNLVGWRNASTAQASGSYPDYTVGSPAAYAASVLTSSNGFLRVATNPAGSGTLTDRQFTSRQQLLDFLQGIGASTNALYLTSFSRSLDQPSYVPATNRPPTQAGNGGNAFGTGSLDGASTGDNLINPSFLSIRTSGSSTRTDGSVAQPGEPLVQKRFPLNRLAWLTYKGPSAENMNDPAVQATITALGGNPNKQSDPVYKYVAQGSAQNIYNSFGLSWAQGPDGSYEWIYSHVGQSPVTTVPTTPAAIKRLDQVSQLNREPDFFETLRATITMGSLGKSYGTTNDGTTAYQATRVFQAIEDSDVDAQIIQIGANIIDQFDADGYPTSILFNNGWQGAPYKEYRGIEDLPYLYRMREAKLRISESVPVTYGLSGNLPLAGTNKVVATAGQGLVLQQPEVWNPHAWSGSDTNPSLRPQSFRIIALTVDPLGNAASSIKLNVRWRSDKIPGSNYLDAPLSSIPASPLTADNSQLLFEMPANYNYLYREPTMLIKPGVPYQSNLRITTGHMIKTLLGSTVNAVTSFDRADSTGNISYTSYPAGVTDNKLYLGFVLGGELLPMTWNATISPGYISSATNPIPATNTSGIIPAEYATIVSGDRVTYRLQYQDPISRQWRTYDEKYAPLIVTGNVNGWSGAASNEKYQFRGLCIGGYDQALTAMDPRTRRFGWHMSGRNTRSAQQQMIPPSGNTGYIWSKENALQSVVATQRPDEYGGYIYWWPGSVNMFEPCGPTAAGWYPGNTATAPSRAGLLSQNNPAAGMASGVVQPTATAGGSSAGSSTLYGFADPAGVLRRGMSAYPRPTRTIPAAIPAIAGASSGLPLKTAYALSSASTFGGAFTISVPAGGSDAGRPIVLNRPFKSVAELGAVFSGTPWRNLDFFTPESGSAALLDVFAVGEVPSTAMTAGKVDLNTRQAPVLQSIIAGSYQNALSPTTSQIPAAGINASAQAVASAIVSRTTGTNVAGGGPFANLAEFVGRYNVTSAAAGATAPYNIDGGNSYVGFSGLAATPSTLVNTPPNLSYLLNQDASSAGGYTTMVVQRYREATIRALANAGQTRVWSLMIDLIVQTGRFPQGASSFNRFLVDGEARYWVHLAIDRLTGQIVDRQVEIVKE